METRTKTADAKQEEQTPTPPAKRPRTDCESNIDRLHDEDLDATTFFQKYVAKRRPCIILPTTNRKRTTLFSSWPDSLDELETLLGDCVVQVEQRADEGQSFGQNRSSNFMTTMTFAEFVRQGPKKRNQFYLSTQEETDEDDTRYSCLTRCLVRHKCIPAHVPLAGHLRLQSCHLWMGATQDSCSGLHHDFHDNFYCLRSGRKTFYLYPPTAPIPVYGTRIHIHHNGLISYKSNPTRADGAPLSLLDRDKGTREQTSRSEPSDDDGDDDDDVDEEKEIVIGKGFDYQSEGEDNGNDDIDSTRDDFDDLDSIDRPDHFSPVHPNDSAMKDMVPIVVELRQGEALYLPASWFHCVWSHVGNGDDEFHIAINYWYHPPDALDSFQRPYEDSYRWCR